MLRCQTEKKTNFLSKFKAGYLRSRGGVVFAKQVQSAFMRSKSITARFAKKEKFCDPVRKTNIFGDCKFEKLPAEKNISSSVSVPAEIRKFLKDPNVTLCKVPAVFFAVPHFGMQKQNDRSDPHVADGDPSFLIVDLKKFCYRNATAVAHNAVF